MTLDVRIGKVTVDCDDGIHFNPVVELCPKSETNISNSAFTVWPCESYRSGSTSFWHFFAIGELKHIYLEMREYPNTNDYEVVKLEPFAGRILALDRRNFKTEADKDRLKWLMYWTRQAVELYGELAAISFS